MPSNSAAVQVIASDRLSVPCNGCRQCCIGDAVRLLSGDNPADYLTEPHPTLPGALMLAHKRNRECVYLGADGCTIHDRAPTQCRTMDCRNIARAIPFTKARQLHKKNALKISVWLKGKELARLG